MVLIGAFRVQLPAQEIRELLVAPKIAGALTADMVKRTHLQVPGVAHESELEQPVEECLRQQLLGGDDLGVPRQLAGDAVTTQVAEAATQIHGPIPGIPPTQGLQAGAHAGAAGLGNVDEQETVLDGEEHGSGFYRESSLSPTGGLVHLRANTDNINPILPLGNILPQRQTRINANGSKLTRPYRPFLIDLRSLALICG